MVICRNIERLVRNWDDLRFFLLIARTNNLTKAALELNVDQATVSRRILAFEKYIDTKLFIRTPKKIILSPIGEQLLPHVLEIEKSIQKINSKVNDTSSNLYGHITIATTDTIAQSFVIPALEKINILYPNLKISLITSINLSNISYGEVDLAIRGSKPEARNLIIKKLNTIEMGLFASKEYLIKKGIPSEYKDLENHNLLMFQKNLVPRHWNNLLGLEISEENVIFQANSQLSLLEATKRNLGVSLLSTFIADKELNITRIFPELYDIVDIWLVIHPDIQKTKKVRVVIDVLESFFNCK